MRSSFSPHISSLSHISILFLSSFPLTKWLPPSSFPLPFFPLLSSSFPRSWPFLSSPILFPFPPSMHGRKTFWKVVWLVNRSKCVSVHVLNRSIPCVFMLTWNKSLFICNVNFGHIYLMTWGPCSLLSRSRRALRVNPAYCRYSSLVKQYTVRDFVTLIQVIL